MILDNIDYPIDLRFIRQINAEIGKGIILDTGMLRILNVKIGGTSWRADIPDEEKVKFDISAILNALNSSELQKAIDTMLYIDNSEKLTK